jgi:hypothetical protein
MNVALLLSALPYWGKEGHSEARRNLLSGWIVQPER